MSLALLVLAATIVGSTLHLREHICAQIASRDGEALDAVAAMQYFNDKTNEEAIAGLDDPGEQMQLVMEISRLRNVLGVRLFSPDGQFVNAAPEYITETTLPVMDLSSLRELKPVSHFLPKAHLEDQDMLVLSNSPPVPLLIVNIPLHEEGEKRLAGVAQFLMNGTSIAQEYAAIDRHLLSQAGLAFGIGGTILAVGLGLAFRSVQSANRLLAQRTTNLLKANRELALAAKTSAVGAVTSHLIHGLKNPLSGLQTFVQDRATEQANGHDTDWALAMTSTQRMQGLISRVVQVLQEQAGTTSYEISVPELIEVLVAKFVEAASQRGVRLETDVTAKTVVSNREADLVLLVLENLVQNALDAVPRDRGVRISAFEEAETLIVEVRDEGPGLPPDLLPRLFTPCTSTKEGGSGIGLAISRQLAKHLGGQLELTRTSPQGCTFRLVLPLPIENGSAVVEHAAAR